MQNPKIEIDVRMNHGKERILGDLDIIPAPMIIYLNRSKEVFGNKYAAEYMGIGHHEGVNFNKWLQMNPHLEEMFNAINKEVVFQQKLLLNHINGEQEMIIFNMRCMLDPIFGTVHIVLFSTKKNHTTLPLHSTLTPLKDDIRELVPYLNRAGKKKLQDISKKYFNDEIEHLRLDDLITYEREMQMIQKAFPFLSSREVLVCGLLLNEIDISEIAALTNRSTNSIFVTVHRINKKLDTLNKVELLQKLQSLFEDQENP